MANLAENINRAISDFDSIKTAIEDKGVTVGSVPTSQYAEKIREISGGSGEEVLFTPEGRCYLKNIVFPDTVTSIDANVFFNCSSLTSITIPNSVTSIGGYAFTECRSLINVRIPDSVTKIGNYAFRYCSSLTSVTIPNSVTSIGGNAFYYCTNITSITLGEGINCTGLIFSSTSKLTAETMVAMMTALADLTGQEAKTLTLGATNLAKLTEEQKRIATSKNWNLA